MTQSTSKGFAGYSAEDWLQDDEEQKNDHSIYDDECKDSHVSPCERADRELGMRNGVNAELPRADGQFEYNNIYFRQSKQKAADGMEPRSPSNTISSPASEEKTVSPARSPLKIFFHANTKQRPKSMFSDKAGKGPSHRGSEAKEHDAESLTHPGDLSSIAENLHNRFEAEVETEEPTKEVVTLASSYDLTTQLNPEMTNQTTATSHVLSSSSPDATSLDLDHLQKPEVLETIDQDTIFHEIPAKSPTIVEAQSSGIDWKWLNPLKAQDMEIIEEDGRIFIGKDGHSCELLGCWLKAFDDLSKFKVKVDNKYPEGEETIAPGCKTLIRTYLRRIYEVAQCNGESLHGKEATVYLTEISTSLSKYIEDNQTPIKKAVIDFAGKIKILEEDGEVYMENTEGTILRVRLQNKSLNLYRELKPLIERAENSSLLFSKGQAQNIPRAIMSYAYYGEASGAEIDVIDTLKTIEDSRTNSHTWLQYF